MNLLLSMYHLIWSNFIFVTHLNFEREYFWYFKLNRMNLNSVWNTLCFCRKYWNILQVTSKCIQKSWRRPKKFELFIWIFFRTFRPRSLQGKLEIELESKTDPWLWDVPQNQLFSFFGYRKNGRWRHENIEFWMVKENLSGCGTKNATNRISFICIQIFIECYDLTLKLALMHIFFIRLYWERQ